MRNLFFALCALGFTNPVMAAQYIQMDQTAVLSVNLSASHHNRIGIIGDRIKKAYFKGSNISVDVEECNGQIFIQTTRHNCPKTTLSIVTANGKVQDLELCFTEGSSEIILLQPATMEEMDALPNSGDICTNLGDSELTDLVAGVLKGDIPEGYTSYEDKDTPTKIKKCLAIQRLSRLVNERQIVFIYRLHNESSSVKYVTECLVNVLDGDWVFLDRYKLNPDESALVLIGCFR